MGLHGHRMGVALAALYSEAGCAVPASAVRKHRKLYAEMREKIARVLKMALCRQLRGMEPRRGMRHSDFHRFEVVETLVAPLPGSAGGRDRTKEEAQHAAGVEALENVEALEHCPLCGAAVPHRALEGHIKEELLGHGTDGRTRVLVDRAFGVAQTEVSIRSENARELKEKIFSELGISVSKQHLFLGERLLGNKDATGGAVLQLRLKKRYE